MTKRYKQFEPLIISDFEVSEWQHPAHKHNHYELVYIKHGSGKHVINCNPVEYSAGAIFLLGPEEEHYFEIVEQTRFIYVKFTDVYFHQEGGYAGIAVKNLEYLIKSRETHQSDFKLELTDKRILDLLFDVIISSKNNLFRNGQLIWMQVLAIADILQRNMPEIRVSENRSRDIQAMFCYIHKYIYNPEQLKAGAMAMHFHFNSQYIGPYFKRNTGMTLRQYISDYRNNLLRQRMQSGRFTLKQLSIEFGLTDESHVSKLLKNQD